MSASVFEQLLGPAFAALPPALARAHRGPSLTLSGRAEVRRSRNPLAWLAGELMRLPRTGRDVPVSVRFDRQGDRECWTRDFAGRRYASDLRVGTGLLVERMGPAANCFDLAVMKGELRLTLVAFRLLGVPLPWWARPRCVATEREENGAFLFDIPVDLPLLGRVIHYSGRLLLLAEDQA